jgi:hypothetical protein
MGILDKITKKKSTESSEVDNKTKNVEQSKTKTKMAKTKKDLIAEGKEIGLNLNSKMSLYELEHRIKDKKDELAKSAGTKETEKKTTKRISGEY